MLFAGLFKRKALCWICLEESNIDASWIRHECGCNLQVHKRCYFRWLFDLNKSFVQGKSSLNFDFEPFEEELKRKMCYAIDGHRDFQRVHHSGEIIGILPMGKVTLNNMFYLPPMLALNVFGYAFPLAYQNVPIELPINIAPCPQCKKPIVFEPVVFTSNSAILAIIYRIRKLIRGTTVIALLTLSTINLGKWSFKLGLWQLRCLFPEQVLRPLLDVSTTKALDVYSETMAGRMSVPNVTQFLIFGFPFYLLGVRGSSPGLKKFQWIYSLIFTVRAGHYHGNSQNVLSKTVSMINLCVLFHSAIVSPTLTRVYEFMVKSVRPYFCLTSCSMDIFPSEEYSEVIIETPWYDVLFESTVWPFLGGLLGGKLFDSFIWLQKEIHLNSIPTGSPNEVQMAFNLLGCGLISVARQTLNLYISYLRTQELKQLQESIEA